MAIWNPWHGCRRISAGCANCYVYRRDDAIGKDASQVVKTADFDLPLRRDRMKQYKLTAADNPVYTCMTSDFFLEEGDAWRKECWQIMRQRRDLEFVIITKRIHRFAECIPEDWGDGYPNVTICCTCENQDRADFRLPILLSSPIRHRRIIHEPMLGPIDIRSTLASGVIESVTCGGESGAKARPCHYDWILSTRQQCMDAGVPFHFKQTGAVFVKDGRTYRIERKLQQLQAAKAGIDYAPTQESHEQWLARDLFQRIRESRFRSRFRLKQADRQYILEKGADTIRRHARDMIRTRLAPAVIPNDGRQTPMRGHPVFLAQHACACCCRECLEKWHGIPSGTQLNESQQEYVVDTLMEWLRRQMEDGDEITLFDSPQHFSSGGTKQD